jgi:hypothetical protein
VDGVTDGTRTHDNQNHNLGLYQLSYGHHEPNTHCTSTAAKARCETGLPGGN